MTPFERAKIVQGVTRKLREEIRRFLPSTSPRPLFRGNYTTKVTVVTVPQTTETRIAQANPNRIGIIFSNAIGVDCRVLPQSTGLSSGGITLPNGGAEKRFKTIDFPSMVESEWYAYTLPGNDAVVTVIEEIMVG